MNNQNESGLTSSQIHFLHYLLDGKREISEKEASIRAGKLFLSNLVFPCVVVCISPAYTGTSYEEKDELLFRCSEEICYFFRKEGYRYYCLINSYDNFQVIFPTDANGRTERDLEELFVRLHDWLQQKFEFSLFIGIGSTVLQMAQLSRSALEAMEMLAFKHQYSNRGVIHFINTARFKHYSIYGEDIQFARVLGRFQDGDLSMMSVRLSELVESIHKRPGISNSAIKRTFAELALNILHIASNAEVDVDTILGDMNIYQWILRQNDITELSEWLIGLSAKLMAQMESKRETEEKEVIRQAGEYVLTHLTDSNLSLQSVSEAVSLSSAYFSQLFKKEKGIGLSNFIMERRIDRACILLKTTELKSEDIALQLGFTSATYFGRVFKRKTGLTPSEYRKQQSAVSDFGNG